MIKNQKYKCKQKFKYNKSTKIQKSNNKFRKNYR